MQKCVRSVATSGAAPGRLHLLQLLQSLQASRAQGAIPKTTRGSATAGALPRVVLESRRDQNIRMPPTEMVRVFRSPAKRSAPSPFSWLYSPTRVMYLLRL